MRKDPERETQIIEGKEHVIIRSSRYTIPIALPTGIYDILERGANSSTSYRERKEASRKFSVAFREAREEDAKLTPKVRKLRDEKRKYEEEKKLLKEREETLKAMESFRASQEVIKQKYQQRLGPPIVLKPLDESDPNIREFRQEMDKLFGTLDVQG